MPQRFQRIIAAPFSRLPAFTRKMAIPSNSGPGKVAAAFAAATGLFHLPRCLANNIERKNMAAVRMSSALKAIICGLPIQLIGRPLSSNAAS
jgi:hypothetical protein